MNDNKNRIAIYDNVKFFLMILVVVGHFVDPFVSLSKSYRCIFLFIYSFHMPLFLFISGQFHKNTNVLSKVVAFFCIGFAQKILFFIGSSVLYQQTSDFHLLSDRGLPWYMFVLAIFIALSYFLRQFDKKFLFVSFLVLALFVGYDQNIGDFLYLSRIIVFYPFYLLGEMVDRKKMIALASDKRVKLVSAVILLFWAFLCVYRLNPIYELRPLFTARNSYIATRLFHDTGAVFRLLCYFISSIVGISFFMVIPSRTLPFITTFGKRTLQVYFWHWPVCMFLMQWKVFENLGRSRMINYIWILLAVVISVILSLKCFEPLTDSILKWAKKCSH